VGFVFGDVVRVDEYVIQINNDNDIDHVHEDIIHKSLKHCWCISKPFRHYQPLEGTITGLECSFPFVSIDYLDKMICMPEIDLV